MRLLWIAMGVFLLLAVGAGGAGQRGGAWLSLFLCVICAGLIRALSVGKRKQ